MTIVGVLMVSAMLVGLGVLLGSRVAGLWYDRRQSEIEDELRAELNVLRESPPARVLVIGVLDRGARVGRAGG